MKSITSIGGLLFESTRAPSTHHGIPTRSRVYRLGFDPRGLSARRVRSRALAAAPSWRRSTATRQTAGPTSGLGQAPLDRRLIHAGLNEAAWSPSQTGNKCGQSLPPDTLGLRGI
jgi:hypothetical protein